MRISTKSFYDTATAQVDSIQAALAHTQQQVATGLKNLTPSDDPLATAQALVVSQAQANNTQLAANRQNAETSLTTEAAALASTTALIQNVQTLAVSASNGSMNDSDRATLAMQLQGSLNDLMGLANTTDASGNYIFSGFQASTQPFTPSAGGATYHGDQGQLQLQIGATQQTAINDSGSSVFENNMTGNGTFTTAAGTVPPNTGTGIVAAGSVTNAAQLTNHNYSINFSIGIIAPSTTPSTTYTVTDNTQSPAVQVLPPLPAVSAPYVSGGQIAFDGLQLNVTGAPANGDTFTVAPSQQAPLFATLSNLIALLNTPVAGAAVPATAQAALTNGLNTAQANLNSALNNVLSVSTSVGNRQNQLTALDTAGSNLDLQYASTLSGLQNVDYVQAASLLTQQQTTLTAAEKSFQVLSGLSLFNYIN